MTETAEVTTAIAEYSPLAAGLADLRHRFENVVFDVTTTKGDKEARAARLELVKLRSSLETKRKELKAPALERSRLIDAEAKRIEGEILALELPLDSAIKAEEKRKEAERQAKIEAERQRVAAIHERIRELQGPQLFPRNPALILDHIGDIERIVVDESFNEFMAQAQAVKAATIARLQALHTEAVEHEAEAARLKAEREQLERDRAEEEARRAEQARVDAEARAADAARAKAERDEQAKKDAEARAAEDARLKAIRDAEDAERAEAARIAREQAEAEAAARRAAQKAEDERLAKQRAEAQAEHDRVMAAEREAAEKERKRLAEIAAEQERARREAEARARAEQEAKDLAERQRRAEAEKARIAVIEGRERAHIAALALVRELAQCRSIDEMPMLVARAADIVGMLDAKVPA